MARVWSSVVRKYINKLFRLLMIVCPLIELNFFLVQKKKRKLDTIKYERRKNNTRH